MIVSLGAVSAADDSNATQATNPIKMTNEASGNISSSSYTVTPTNYGNYFSGDGSLKTCSKCQRDVTKKRSRRC